MPDELLAWSARTEATDRPIEVVKARLAAALGTRYVVRGLDEQRIRDAYRAYLLIAAHTGRDGARAWFQVPLERLGDPSRTPAQAVRDGAGGLVVKAAGLRVQDGWSA